MTLPTFLLSMTVSLPSLHQPAAAKPPLDLVRMAAAIETVEDTDNHVIGQDGERSRFQIMRDVWQLHSAMPFRLASDPRLYCRAEATRVAVRHITWIAAQLDKAGVAVTPYSVALGWGAGVTAAVQGTASARKRDYAQRAANVYGAKP